MQSRKVSDLEAFLLEQCNSQRIPDRQRDCRARSGCQIVHAGLFAHPRVERNVGVPGECRLHVARNRDCADTKSLQMIKQRDELIRFAALGDENGDVRLADDSQVTVLAVGRMEERRRRAGRSERRCDLPPDVA